MLLSRVHENPDRMLYLSVLLNWKTYLSTRPLSSCSVARMQLCKSHNTKQCAE